MLHLKLSDIFELARGKSKYTKNWGNINRGDFPVYSAALEKPLTFIDTYDYEGEFLTWTINGFGGFTKIIKGKFSVNADRGILIPKEPNIYLPYFKYLLEPILRDLSVGRIMKNGKNEYTKVYPSMLDNLYLDIEEDVDLQKNTVKKYEKLEQFKVELMNFKSDLESIYFKNEMPISNDFKVVQLKNIFDIDKGNSKYTRDYIQQNIGKYPVYSSQTSKDGIIGTINTYDYDCECLTWTTDGVHAGTVFLRKGRFSMTTHCGALMLQQNANLYLPFLRFALSSVLKGYAISDLNRRVTKTIIENVSIKIPINHKGEFNLPRQKELAKLYEKNRLENQGLIQIRDRVLKNMSNLINKKVDIKITYNDN